MTAAGESRLEPSRPAIPAGDGFKLSLGPRQSLAEQAAEALVEGIATGALKPGEKLVEAEIATALGISRIPVREALKVLEVQGIVVSSLHRGVTVAAFDHKVFSDVRRIRTDLEKVVARDAATRIAGNPDRVAPLERLIGQMMQFSCLGDWSTLNKLDLAFHREMCAISENRVAATLWEALARYTRIIFGHEVRTAGDASFIAAEHEDLLRVLRSGDAAAIDREIERHINHARL